MLGVKCIELDFAIGDNESKPERHGRIRERYQRVQQVDEPRLLKYKEFHLDDSGRLYLFTEHRVTSVRSELLSHGPFEENRIRVVARGVLQGLNALAALGMVHRNLSPESIMLEPETEFTQLADWGSCFITDFGRLVDPPIFVGAPQYAAPEVFASSFNPVWKSDVWSLGVCMLEMLTGRNIFADAAQIAAVCDPSTGKDVLTGFLECPEMDRCSADLKNLIVQCLQVDPASRWDSATASQCPFFTQSPPDAATEAYQWKPTPFLASSRLTAPTVEELYPLAAAMIKTTKMHSRDRSLEVVPEPTMGSVIESDNGNGYLNDNNNDDDDTALLQQLHEMSMAASGDLDGEKGEEELSLGALAKLLIENAKTFKNGLPSVFPELHLLSRAHGLEPMLGATLTLRHQSPVFGIDLEEARARARLTVAKETSVYYELWNPSEPLPDSLEEREQDFGYQQHRVNVFLLLLAAGDREAIAKEAAIDVPPVLRMEIWARLLDLESWEACDAAWDLIEPELADAHSSDHQIEVDVPRCNARHEVIGTDEGRLRLTRVLKAWCIRNPGLEYWQGLDSLAAPFVALTIDCGEGRAFAMLSRMVTRFLAGMFLQKNTSQLQTQLIVFNQLLAFHDPQLYLHLQEQQFNPELYAIPWFLTLFTHILSIDSTLRLWDFLFLHDATMIHFSSIAVMRQLRTRLLALDFNDLVLFFSELHAKSQIDMARVLFDAVRVARVTPPSLCSDHSQEGSEHWWEQKGSLETLQEHYSPKLSVEDLVNLLQQNRMALLVFDIRSPEDFKACHMEGAINIAAQDVDIRGIEQIKVRKPIIVSISERGRETELPNILVRAGIARVTYISGGMDALKLHGDVKLIKG